MARVSLEKPLSARVRMVNEALVRNLSMGGALIETGRALAPGSLCEIHLEAGGVTATVKAKVARCHLLAGSATSYSAGLEFRELDEKTRAAVEKILKSARGPLPGTIQT